MGTDTLKPFVKSSGSAELAEIALWGFLHLFDITLQS